MYEPTKKRRVAEDVAKVFPKEVTNQIFDVIAVMNKAKKSAHSLFFDFFLG